jgi:hypothetical protein
MRRAKKQPDRKRHTDIFTISGGALGPVPACELEIRPFTVFVGAQGTGKSLVAQTLYAFEELPFLMAYVSIERGASLRDSVATFHTILGRLRSSERRFGTFANPDVTIAWQRSSGDEWLSAAPEKLSFRANSAGGKVTAKRAMRQVLDAVRAARNSRQLPLHHAVFFPTERMVISQLRSAMSADYLALPITFSLFTHWMDDHAAPTVANWSRGKPDTPEGRMVEQLGAAALGGQARKHGDQWKWQFGSPRARQQFNLDMASSGQRANWSLPYLASTLFSIRGTGDVGEVLTIFVEEPEIHLHPRAQRNMIEILALLVHSGFRVVVTTHSLVVLYTLNNLMQAALLDEGLDDPDLPAAELRIHADDVSVYAFSQGKPPKQLVDADRAFIDETELGRVDEELSAELNAVAARLDERT